MPATNNKSYQLHVLLSRTSLEKIVHQTVRPPLPSPPPLQPLLFLSAPSTPPFASLTSTPFMPRPRRAAAVKAVAVISAPDSDSDSSTPATKAQKTMETPSPTKRRLRRASYRTAKRMQRSLHRRRADFERIATHHVNSRKGLYIDIASASFTDLGTNESSQQGEEHPLDADYVQKILDEGDNEDAVIAGMKHVLKRLKGLDNINEDEDIEGGVKNRPRENDDLKGMAAVLCADRFVSHDSLDVKLFTACAMAEVLRICAPDPPVDMYKLNRICSLFIEQLCMLASDRDEMEMYRFSLLEQLACVKTFVIFCDEEEVMCDLFACFYAVVTKNQPDKMKQYFADILVSMLDETETLTYDVLDALVAPLIPSLRYSKNATYLAAKVVQMASNAIQVPLCSMLNASVRRIKPSQLRTPERGKKRTPTKRKQHVDDQDVDLSVHHDHIAELIVGLNRIASELLIYVVPGLEDRIRSADEDVRSGNVALLAKLFTSKKDMVEAYPSLFEEFLTRHKDVCPKVRAQVCTAAADLIMRHPKYRSKLDEMLRDRVLDRDEEVRAVAVRAIGTALNVASEDLLQALATRLRDTKATVRSIALTQLTRLVAGSELSNGRSSPKEKAESDKEGDSENDDNDENDLLGSDDAVPRIVKPSPFELEGLGLRKYSWVPDKIVQAHMALRSSGDVSAANEIEQVIFDRIPRPDSYDTKTSISRFAIFIGSLSVKAFAHVVHLASERCRCAEALRDLANFRISSRKKGSSSPDKATKKVTEQAAEKGTEKTPEKATERSPGAQTFSRKPSKEDADNPLREPPLESTQVQTKYNILSRFFHAASDNGETALKQCSSLAGAPDLKIFERLLTVVGVQATQGDRIVAYQDVLARVGSKSALGNFLRDQLFPKSLPGVFTSPHFEQACALAKTTSETSGASKPDDADVEVNESSIIELRGVLRYLELASQHAVELLGHNVNNIRSLLTAKSRESSSDVMLVGLRLLARLAKYTKPIEDPAELQQVLAELMLEKTPVDIEWTVCLAKWATRAFISVSRAEDDGDEKAAQDVLSKLTARLGDFDGDVKGIIAPITSLSQIARHNSNLFKHVALECFDFVRAVLCGSFNEKLLDVRDKIGLQEHAETEAQGSLWRRCAVPIKSEEEIHSGTGGLKDRQALCLSVLVHRAVKILVYGLDCVDAEEELDSVFETLLDVILVRNGNVFSVNVDETEEEDAMDDGKLQTLRRLYANSRLSAGRGMLYLARHPKYFRKISPPIFVSVLLLAQDEQTEVRLGFIRTITTMILKKRLPFRWISALPLMCVDPAKENVVQIGILLGGLIRHRRRVFEKARLDVSRGNSLQLLPEICVAELIWVLAHLPDVEIDRESGFAECEKCIEFLVERLLESNEYAGVLHEYIESLSIAQDATEGENGGTKTKMMGELARLAGKIMKKKQAGRKWNLVEFPGSVALPKDMFRVADRNVETSGVVPPTLLDVARRYDKEDEEVMFSDRKAKPTNVVRGVTAVKSVQDDMQSETKGTEVQSPKRVRSSERKRRKEGEEESETKDSEVESPKRLRSSERRKRKEETERESKKKEVQSARRVRSSERKRRKAGVDSKTVEEVKDADGEEKRAEEEVESEAKGHEEEESEIKGHEEEESDAKGDGDTKGEGEAKGEGEEEEEEEEVKREKMENGSKEEEQSAKRMKSSNGAKKRKGEGAKEWKAKRQKKKVQTAAKAVESGVTLRRSARNRRV